MEYNIVKIYLFPNAFPSIRYKHSNKVCSYILKIQTLRLFLSSSQTYYVYVHRTWNYTVNIIIITIITIIIIIINIIIIIIIIPMK